MSGGTVTDPFGPASCSGRASTPTGDSGWIWTPDRTSRLKGIRVVVRAGPFEDHQGGDMPERRRGLHIEERGVQAGELFHKRLLDHSGASNGNCSRSSRFSALSV